MTETSKKIYFQGYSPMTDVRYFSRGRLILLCTLCMLSHLQKYLLSVTAHVLAEVCFDNLMFYDDIV